MEAVCSSAHEEVVWFDHWTDVDIYKYWSFKVKKNIQNTRHVYTMYKIQDVWKVWLVFTVTLPFHSATWWGVILRPQHVWKPAVFFPIDSIGLQ